MCSVRKRQVLILKIILMSTFLEQKDLFDNILLLGEEEREDPMTVFERFFSDYRLHECRYILWTMVETCLTTDNAEFSNPEERSDLLTRYKDLERFLEAGNLLLANHKKNIKPVNPNPDLSRM
jgi:hypothetical protein